MEPDLLNLTETAEALGVHRNTISRWIAKGVLTPAVSGEGVAPRIRRTDVDALRGEREAVPA